VRVTPAEDAVLVAFVDSPVLSGQELVDMSGRPRAVYILATLRRKYGGVFASAITMPGRRDGGGYRADVRMIEDAVTVS
jgi:hypothetical protein